MKFARVLLVLTAALSVFSTAFSAVLHEINEQKIRDHVSYLASPELAGRMTGTEGERLATEYVAQNFREAGLETQFQEFEFISSVTLGSTNLLSLGAEPAVLNQDWRPLGFSDSGSLEQVKIVFAGYGIQAPAEAGFEEYNSYRQMDPALVRGKWVLVFRYAPEAVSVEQKLRLSRYASLEYKAAVARDLGALGLLVVTGPNALVRDQLVGLKLGSGNARGFFGASLSNDLGARMLRVAGFDLGQLQTQLDQGEWLRPFEIPGIQLSTRIELMQNKSKGRNVLGLLRAQEGQSVGRVIVGAHVDHLGLHEGHIGEGSIYLGADDNASGVSAVLEMARTLSAQVTSGTLQLKKDILFAAWSGEELGLRGSQHFVQELKKQGPVFPTVATYFNLDMVGRLRERLYLQAVGSSSIWPAEIARVRAQTPFEILEQSDPYLPTDSTSFYLEGVPVLAAYTGTHPEYHTPQDQVGTLNIAGIVQVANVVKSLVASQAASPAIPDFIRVERTDGGNHTGYRATLGVMPDYSAEGVTGLRVLGTREGSPAQKAGVLAGDVIVQLAGKEIRTIHDYMFALNIVKIREPNVLIVMRAGVRLSLVVIPEPKE